MTVREALGGPWASHWALMVALIPSSTLLVLLRELATPFPNWWWPLASALAQNIVAGAVIIGGGLIARRRSRIIPIITVLSLWILAAVLRGIVGGTVAAVVAGVDPEYALRIAVWVLVTVAWLPLMVYAVAQFERRRLILGALDIAQFDLAQQGRLSDAHGADMQHQLRHAIAESLSPALDDLQSSLLASRHTLDRAAVAELSLRLSQLHDNASDLLESARVPRNTPPRHQVSVLRAIDVPPRRPWLSALLVGSTTILLIVVDVWRVFGPLAAIEVLVAAATAAAVIGALPVTVAALRPDALSRHGQRITTVATILAIFIASFLMLNSGIDPLTGNGLIIVPLLALSLAIASATCFSAIVLADANRETGRLLSLVDVEVDQLRESNRHAIERERRRLSGLMHGPVQGRIAACVMALNFHATSKEGGDQARFITESVLDHLQAVSRELGVITEDVARTAP